MKTKTETKMVSREWGKILPVKGSPKMKYRENDDVDWMFKALGWKKK